MFESVFIGNAFIYMYGSFEDAGHQVGPNDSLYVYKTDLDFS